MPPEYHPLSVFLSLEYNPQLRGENVILPLVIVVVILVVQVILL
jgi:hypothetical protein